MKKVLPSVCFVSVVLFAFSTMAADKVVVIPLGGSSLARKSCKSGEYVSGFDANGNLICQHPWKYVFHSEALVKGDFGGASVADQICQTEADAASLGGTYKAWVSDYDSNPATAFAQSIAPYVLVDGTVIASHWSDLTDGAIFNGIGLTAVGNPATGSVWTGTMVDGSKATYTCSGWKSQTPDSWTTVGYPASSEISWTFSITVDYGFLVPNCSNSMGFYCFEQ